METTLINNNNSNLDNPNHSPIMSTTLLLPNAINNYHHFNNNTKQFQKIVDVEMVAFQSDQSYTSLRDLLPANEISNRKDSWREIPIKDPLLQQAAWAYLRPAMTAARDSNARCCVERLRDGLCGCFDGWFNGVVVAAIRMWIWEDKSDDDDDDDDDDDGGGKVD
ncbi:hypothetical protein LguiB_022421 [Lonicera macranthoides]